MNPKKVKTLTPSKSVPANLSRSNSLEDDDEEVNLKMSQSFVNLDRMVSVIG